jgi:hypothetical protein
MSNAVHCGHWPLGDVSALSPGVDRSDRNGELGFRVGLLC